jgi:hypothetical protein
MHVCNSSAFGAADMVVIGDHPIKALLRSSYLQLLYHSRLGKYLKIAIDSPQAYFGNPFAHQFVDLARSGMCVKLVKFFKYDPALPSHPELV